MKGQAIQRSTSEKPSEADAHIPDMCTDPELAAVVDAWPDLDHPIRKAIAQLCRSAHRRELRDADERRRAAAPADPYE